jgi:D-alanyl-D-alanine carboxypeptidase
MKRYLCSICLLATGCYLRLLGGVTPASAAPPGGSGGLSGTASWPMELVREYVKKEYGIDVSLAAPAWRNRDMAARLNGEFVKRLDALMAIYQALGENPDLEIEKPYGGLHSAQEQKDLYKLCRRIKRSFGLGQPIGDGSKESDWEEIPGNERTSEGLQSQTGHVGGGTVVYEKHGPLDNCSMIWVRKMPNGDVYQHTGPVTDAWVSWHNIGLAADLAETVVDKKGRVYDNGLPNSVPWVKLTTIMGDLGMTWGGWWPWDPDHVEFHPQMFSAESAGTSGQPLPDSQLRTQYTWKLPDTVFSYVVDIGNPNGDYLRVYTFGTQADGTITLKAFRTITGEQGGKWSGRWAAFDPPIPLFPAYIPTIRLGRNSHEHPEDAKFDSDTTVTAYSYSKSYWSDGKPSFDWRKHVGKVHYTLDLKMENRQFEANRAYGMSVPYYKPNRSEYDRIRKLWHYLAHTSVYDLRADLSDESHGFTMQQTGRRSDHDGYTEELDIASVASAFAIRIIEFGWDRDGGKVGSELVTAREQNGQYLLTEGSPMGPQTVSDKLPPRRLGHGRTDAGAPRESEAKRQESAQ